MKYFASSLNFLESQVIVISDINVLFVFLSDSSHLKRHLFFNSSKADQDSIAATLGAPTSLTPVTCQIDDGQSPVNVSGAAVVDRSADISDINADKRGSGVKTLSRSVVWRHHSDLGESPVYTSRPAMQKQKFISRKLKASIMESKENHERLNETSSQMGVALDHGHQSSLTKMTDKEQQICNLVTVVNSSAAVSNEQENTSQIEETKLHHERYDSVEAMIVECNEENSSNTSITDASKSPSLFVSKNVDTADSSEKSDADDVAMELNQHISNTTTTEEDDCFDLVPLKVHPRLHVLTKIINTMSPVGQQLTSTGTYVNTSTTSDLASINSNIATSSPIHPQNKFLHKLQCGIQTSSPIAGNNSAVNVPLASVSCNVLHRATDSGFDAMSAIEGNLGHNFHSTTTLKDVSVIEKRDPLTDLMIRDKENNPSSVTNNNSSLYSLNANNDTGVESFDDNNSINDRETKNTFGSATKFESGELFKAPICQVRGRKRAISHDASPKICSKKANLSPSSPDRFIFPPIPVSNSTSPIGPAPMEICPAGHEEVVQNSKQTAILSVAFDHATINLKNGQAKSTGLTKIFKTVDLENILENTESNLSNFTNDGNDANDANSSPPSYLGHESDVKMLYLDDLTTSHTNVLESNWPAAALEAWETPGPDSPMGVHTLLMTTPLVNISTTTAPIGATDKNACTPVARPEKLTRTRSSVR